MNERLIWVSVMCGYREGIAYYIYIFLGVMLSVGVGSMAIYCYHQRRVRRFVEHDNMNNNMQRHSLVDRSAVYAYTKCWLLCIVTHWLGALCVHAVSLRRARSSGSAPCATTRTIRPSANASCAARPKVSVLVYLLQLY